MNYSQKQSDCFLLVLAVQIFSRWTGEVRFATPRPVLHLRLRSLPQSSVIDQETGETFSTGYLEVKRRETAVIPTILVKRKSLRR